MPKAVIYQEELLDLAAEAFTEANEQRLAAIAAQNRARKLKKKARVLRERAGQVERKRAEDEGTVGYRATVGLIDLRWPFRKALARRGWTIPDMLAAMGLADLSAGTVRSWLKPSQPRKIPERWALYFEEYFTPRDKDGKIIGKTEVPTVDASWPGGIYWATPRK